MDKFAIVARWQRYLAAASASIVRTPEAEVTMAFLSELQKEGRTASRRTLYNWQKKCAGGAGAEGLIDGRQRKKERIDAAKCQDPFLLCVAQIWADQNERGLPVCYNAAVYLAGRNGWAIRTLSAARRFLDSIDSRAKVLARQGKEAFVNQAKVFNERDYTTGSSNDIWVSDHHTFDVWVKVGQRVNPKTGLAEWIHVRPYLTVWMDMRSRKVTGWVIRAEDPNYDVVLQALCAGCLSHYIPENVYSDNGKDYDASALTGETKAQRRARKASPDAEDTRANGIYAALGITHTHAIPLHPQSKPVERFFGTVCSRFSKLWPTYCGSSPETRPEGCYERRDAGEGPTLLEFIQAFASWLENDYHNRVHSGQGMDDTPARVWEANLRTKRVAPREVLEILMQPRFPAKVYQLGVRVNGLTYGKFVLNGYLGQTLFVRVNSADVSSVSVWNQRDEFLAFAPCNSPLPMNTPIADLRAAQKQIAVFTKAQKQAWELPQLHIAQDLPTLLLAAAAAKHPEPVEGRPALPAPEATMKLVRSDLEAHALYLQSAREEQRALPPAASPGLSIESALDAYGGSDDEPK